MDTERAYLFERMFIERIDEIRKEKKITKVEFANQVWGTGKGAPRRVLHSLLYEVPKTGTFQSVKVRELYRMCEVLGVDFPGMAWEIDQQLNAYLKRPPSIGDVERP